jgi:deoxycytidylate deaminase
MATCRWTDLAIKEALKSDFKQKMGAVVFNKNQYISSGHNYGCRSIASHLSKFRRYPTSLHAEVIAIINAKIDLKGASIIVVRINNNKEFRLSKPCHECMNYLKYIGIKKIYYSIETYPYIEMIKNY